ncbi:hypothetical protein ACISRB_22975, partial [Micromonospora aurantiaca]
SGCPPTRSWPPSTRWSPALRLGLILPHVLAGVTVLVLLAAGRVRRDTPVPFGPALLGGAWLAAVLG